MSNSIYLPTFLSPKNLTIDSTIDTNFNARVNGLKITHFQIKVYKITDNSLIYDSTKITLNPILYDKETLNFLLPTNSLQNGLDCKWVLQVWNNVETVSTGEVFFRTRKSPTLTLNVPSFVEGRSYEFIANYSQDQNVQIKKFKFLWTDETHQILEDSGYLFSGNIRYAFDGFDNDKTYNIKCIVENQVGVITETPYIPFNVSYSQPSLIIAPDVELIPSTSAIKTKWSQAKQIDGVVAGDYNYINNFLTNGNTGLRLPSDSTLEYQVEIPEDFTVIHLIQFDTGFAGVFCKLDENYEIGYENGRFYFNNDGVIERTLPMEIDGNQFIIAIRPTNIYIRPLNLFRKWNMIDGKYTWGQLSDKTWKDLMFLEGSLDI